MRYHTTTVAEGAGYYDVNSGVTVTNLDAFPAGTKFSDAAGAYQIVPGTFKDLEAALGLRDFQPATQDLMGAYLLYKTGAARALLNGDLPTAIKDASEQWAAIPEGSDASGLNHSGYPYSKHSIHAGHFQPSMDYQKFINLYHANGGT